MNLLLDCARVVGWGKVNSQLGHGNGVGIDRFAHERCNVTMMWLMRAMSLNTQPLSFPHVCVVYYNHDDHATLIKFRLACDRICFLRIIRTVLFSI